MKLLLGLDCSLSSTGVAIVDFKTNTVIKTFSIETYIENHNTLPERIYFIKKEFQEIFDEYDFYAIGIEDSFTGKNVRTAKKLGYVIGSGMMLSMENGKIPELIFPKTHKKTTTGNGNATKEETIKSIEKIYNIEIPYVLTRKTKKIKIKKGKKLKNDNIADALSICNHLRKKIKNEKK